MALILEYDRGQLQPTGPLDEHLPVRVDQYVIDGRVLEQRLERAEPDHLVDHVIGDLRLFPLVELHALGLEQLRDQRAGLSRKASGGSFSIAVRLISSSNR